MTKQNGYKHSANRLKPLSFALLLSVALMPHATAHLMVAQQGTINIFKDGAYLVLSLPISAFDGVDDDKDGKLSITEFTKHRPAIVKAVNEQVQLFDPKGSRPLQGMMLSPVTPHDDPKAPASQLVIMGRFALENTHTDLHFHMGLFGTKPEEQSLKMIATRSAKPKRKVSLLTPDQPKIELFRKAIEH